MQVPAGELVRTRDFDARLVHVVDGVPVEITPASSLAQAESERAAALVIDESTPVDTAALGRLDTLRALLVHGGKTSLKAWWPGLLALPQLEILVINGQKAAKALPAGIEKLASLRQLEISASKLTALDPAVGALGALETLVLDGSAFASLPPELGALAKLRVLSVVGLPLTVLPAELAQLAALTELSASYTKLDAFPEQVLGLVRLETLSLGNDKKAMALPAAIGGLGALKVLLMSGLKVLPPEIGALSRLENLFLANGALAALPDTIGRLGALRRLAVYGNKLKALPESIGELGALEVLQVQRNKLTSLPAAITRLRSLVELELGENPLGALPEGLATLPALKKVDLSLAGDLAHGPVAEALRARGVAVSG